VDVTLTRDGINSEIRIKIEAGIDYPMGLEASGQFSIAELVVREEATMNIRAKASVWTDAMLRQFRGKLVDDLAKAILAEVEAKVWTPPRGDGERARDAMAAGYAIGVAAGISTGTVEGAGGSTAPKTSVNNPDDVKEVRK